MLAWMKAGRYAGGMATLLDALRREISRARKRGVTPYQLWQKTGISQATLSRLVNGKAALDIGHAETLAKALGHQIRLVPTPARRKGR